MEKIGELTEDNVRIVVVIPYRKGAKELAKKAANIHHVRAGMPCEVYFVEDTNKEGWVAIHNKMVKELDFDYYVYSCDDYFPSRGYIKYAFETLKQYDKKFFCYNDGKWAGQLATAAMVEKKFIEDIEEYGGDNLFNPDYFMSYGDSELTDIAVHKDEYCYNPNVILMEIDYEKETKPHTNQDDKLKYINRKVKWKKWFG